jgi:predicted transcriptional regulator
LLPELAIFLKVKYFSGYTALNMPEPATKEQIFSVLADRHSTNILKMAYSGFKASGTSYVGNLSKKQFYVRLKRLRDFGLVEKRNSTYRTTTFGSLIFNGHIRTLEEILVNYWNLKAVDMLKSRQDFPLQQKEKVIDEIIKSSSLRNIVNGTHLSGFSVIKDYNQLIIEVTKLMESAQQEVYMVSRYHDPHFSKVMFRKVADGIKMHLLDSLPEQISVENRLNAVLRTPPDRETFEMVEKLLKSGRFDLRRKPVSASFMVVDGTTVCYETTSYTNPEQFTLAISHYDDPYLARRFIDYYKTLANDATIPQILISLKER